MKTLKLVLIGFGNAGQAFAGLLLLKKRELAAAFGANVLITGIATASKGSLIQREGIDIQKALDDAAAKGRFENAPRLSAFEVIESSEADVLVELSPLSIADGQPATTHIERAMNKGMHVITANKGPVAWAFERLAALAAKQRVNFLYETTVMDGAPVFNMVKHGLPGCKVLGFEGILNTTTNFILSELEKGAAFGGAVLEAQRRGFAESDPSMDIKGLDAAVKTCALANVLMGANMTPPEVSARGIEGVTADDTAAARRDGGTIKLLCRGRAEASGVRCTVGPELVPLGHPFAAVGGTSSALSVVTDLMGRVTIFEHDPEIEQTAYGIYSDTLTLLSRLEKHDEKTP